MFKDLQKFIKANHIIAVVGLLLLAVFVSQYSGRKGNVYDSMSSNVLSPAVLSESSNSGSDNSYGGSNVSPSAPLGQNESYSSVSGIGSPAAAAGLPPSCSRQPVANPDELLPRDENSQWAQLNPRGVGDLNNVNLLQAGFWNGINTVGSSLRNANLQIRSEPPNPQAQVSPWMNTTIEPDMMRLPLEIGGAR